MSLAKAQPQQPGLVYRSTSRALMAATGMICRTFLYGLNDVEVVGMDNFLKLLDSRMDVGKRKRGLVTLSNHTSVLDDPVIWGVLPLRYLSDNRQLRWSLGSHDICFNNSLTGRFFCAGQTLPTHRLRHSPWGGLFQPTINQAVRLLSAQPLPTDSTKLGEPIEDLSLPSGATSPSSASSLSSSHRSSTPIFTSSFPPSLYYSTNGVDSWPAPSAYGSNRHAWVHIFPEGLVHQQRDRALRYFKWGVARLILESTPAPDVVPMFIDGLDRVMHEERSFPRFIPRIGQKIRIVFGDTVDPATFADLRDRWQTLVAQAKLGREGGGSKSSSQGQQNSKIDLKYGKEAQQIRTETAMRMRDEVLKLRRRFGYPDEDPSQGLGLAETWSHEPNKKRYRSQVDDSMVYEE